MLERELMPPSPNPQPQVLALDQRKLLCCHVYLPDTPKPTSAIAYQGNFYGYVKFFSNSEAAQRAIERLQAKGNQVLLTRVPKGLVLWVLELDAQLALK